MQRHPVSSLFLTSSQNELQKKHNYNINDLASFQSETSSSVERML